MAFDLTKTDEILHQRALGRAAEFRRVEADLLDIVDRVDRVRLYRKFGRNSLFAYCTDLLKLPEDISYCLINVMRAARRIPELKSAVANGLALSKARRIAPILTPENQERWIKAACELPKAKLEREIAAENPRAVERETARPSSADRVQLSFYVSEAGLQLFERAREVASNSIGRLVTFEETLARMCEIYLDKEDPVRHAERNANRKNASAKTKVNARDRGRCQGLLADGSTCGATLFPHAHHRVARYHGGPDTPENMVTLCAGCHREWHARERDVPLYNDPARAP